MLEESSGRLPQTRRTSQDAQQVCSVMLCFPADGEVEERKLRCKTHGNTALAELATLPRFQPLETT
jgi:hypothetical protein